MPASLDFSVLWRKMLKPFVDFFGTVGLIVLIAFLALLVYAYLKYQFPLRLNTRSILRLKRMRINMQLLDFIRWMVLDLCYQEKCKNDFTESGVTLYCGRQGRGKTVSMIHYANWIHERYPECIIVSNFSYKYADMKMKSWHDFMDIRNGKEGVLFLIDEIHSEFSSAAWKDFPENLLTEISQQRKQRIKIAATAQIYTRVVKQIREQTDTVVQCSTIQNRWTFNKEYDAKDYELYSESVSQKTKLRPIRRVSFVQSDALRRCYDTYEKIERLAKMKFIPRHERGAS